MDQVTRFHRWETSRLPLLVAGMSSFPGERDRSLPKSLADFWLMGLKALQDQGSEVHAGQWPHLEKKMALDLCDWLADRLFKEEKDPLEVLREFGWSVDESVLIAQQKDPDAFERRLVSLRRQQSLSEALPVPPTGSSPRRRMRIRG